MLDYEKSWPEKEQDKAKIAELEGKLAGADQTAEDRIAKARGRGNSPERIRQRKTASPKRGKKPLGK